MKTMMYKNVCIVDTTYSLSLYLLKMSMGEINSTLFFVGNNINQDIQAHLPHVVHVDMRPINKWEYCWKEIFNFRLKFLLKYWFIYFPWIRIFAQDHVTFADIMIYRKKYTLIEDAPRVYSQLSTILFLRPFIPFMGDTKKWRIKYHLSHGPIFGKKFGTNKQCVNRWVTTKEDLESEYIKGKKHELIDYAYLWRSANDEKRSFIKSLYHISDELIRMGKGADLIICSQPFMEDCGLDEDEMLDLYSPQIAKYTSVVIKPHPRDQFNYEKHFPSVYVMRTYAPMQLLNAIGIVFPVALTICSSALSNMPNETKRIYLGTKIHDKIFKVYGDLYN